MTEYVATWPIENQDQTMTELTTEGVDLLHEMLEQQALMIDGPIRWKVNCGETPRLTARCRVRKVFTRTKSDQVAEDIEHILADDPTATADQIAPRLGYARTDSLLRVLHRGNRRDLTDRLARNAQHHRDLTAMQRKERWIA